MKASRTASVQPGERRDFGTAFRPRAASMRAVRPLAIAALACLAACSASPATTAPSASSTKPEAPARVVLSLVGTNDLHGHVEATPLLGGYLANLRKARAKDGAVLLVDAGDMFQGTLESNLGEGVAVLHAYAALGVDAATVGNHEFDYGPVGAAATPSKPGDDPLGALEARIHQASFPILAANVVDAATKKPIARPSAIVDKAGLRVGVIGVATTETLTTTISANVEALEIEPLATTIEAEARRLRADERADLVVVLAHAGGACKRFSGDVAKDGCEQGAEIFSVARALPKGTVDAIVAGHTHQGVAETVNGVPIIESFSYGRAFGRVDFTIDKSPGAPARVVSTHVFAPENVCADRKADPADCEPVAYEGAPVARDPAVAKAIAGDVEKAAGQRAERIGVVLEDTLRAGYDRESAEGNLFTDLMRKHLPEVKVALTNGGGLRADLPAGALTFGALYQAFPFDNKLAFATVSGADLARVIRSNLRAKGGVLSVSGVRVRATCDGKKLDVRLEYDDGKPVGPTDALRVVASDFMFSGGDAFWGSVPPPKIDVSDELVRDAIVAELAKLKTIRASDYFDRKRRRLDLPGDRPVRCD
jgi:5'-nucleotidase